MVCSGMLRLARAFLSFLAVHAATLSCAQAAERERVDVVLVLAVDVSLSMSAEELSIQREGYAAAIRSPEVVAAIGRGAYGRIAVTMFEWAADTSINSIIDWTVIETQDDADRVSAQLFVTPSAGMRRTSISGAIHHGAALLEDAPFIGDRMVIDVSGDGPNNQGRPVTEARDAAVAKGFIINGLPMMTKSGPSFGYDIENLDRYYADCVIGGPGGFMVPVNDWEQFPEAIRRKLVLEIGSTEPPARVIRAQFDTRSYDCLIGEKIWQQRGWQFDDFNR